MHFPCDEEIRCAEISEGLAELEHAANADFAEYEQMLREIDFALDLGNISPFPWGWHGTTPIIIHDKKKDGICHVVGKTLGQTEQAEANAALISTAPELFACLKTLCEQVRKSAKVFDTPFEGDDEIFTTIKTAETVISRALQGKNIYLSSFLVS